ncbi:KH domain-containing protein [Candidatus Peregrinibacteria bacterium]|nr:KH domain-containing protein [Candidatus Peregrinibacteria bacterium]
MENTIHQILEDLVAKMGCSLNKIRIEKQADQNNSYRVNIETSHPNLMIGYRGENINALQHLTKLLLWNKLDQTESPDRPEITLDIDNYRRRQEQHVIDLAERKVEMVRKLSSPQSLPAMAPYFRRVVHLHLAQEKFNDISTESQGEGEYRYIVIKPELVI